MEQRDRLAEILAEVGAMASFRARAGATARARAKTVTRVCAGNSIRHM